MTFDYDGLDRMTAVKQSGTTTVATYTYNQRTDIGARTNGAEASTRTWDAGVGELDRMRCARHHGASKAAGRGMRDDQMTELGR